MSKNKTSILNKKYTAKVDESTTVIIEGKDKGCISTQSVEAILLLEIVRTQHKILDELEKQNII